MSLSKYSGLVALGLALLSCNVVQDTLIVSVKPTNINFDGVYKIDSQINTGSAVAVKCVKIDATSYEVILISARHVVKEPENILIPQLEYNLVVYQTSDGLDTTIEDFRAPILYREYNPVFDIVLLKVIVPHEIPIRKISASRPKTGDEVFSIGYPFNEGKFISSGYISNYDQKRNKYWFTATSSFGQSGGAILDKKTNCVIGILTDLYGTESELHEFMVAGIPFYMISDWLKERGLI